jgi:uncharacterized membrane protein
MLAQYEQVKPGMAERIVVLLEQESSHRRESFDKEQRHTHITERIGQWLTATLTAGGIGVAGYAVACGSAGAAATIVVALFSVGGVVFSLKNRGSRQRDSGER